MLAERRKSRSAVARACVAVLLFGALTPAAFATFVTFTDRADFLAAASGASLTTVNEDFAINPGDPFAITDGTNSVTLDVTVGTITGGQISGGNIILNSTALSGLANGIGFDYSYGGAASSNPGIATPETGSLSGPSVPNDGTVGFFGVLSVDGMTISAVNSLTTGQGFGTSTMDNIVIATGGVAGPLAVPEPGSLLLLTLGAIGVSGLGFVRRRRRAKV